MNESEMERGRTVYLTTLVFNGVDKPYALKEHSTWETISDARKWADHNLKWFGVKQGFKTICRISIDNLFEEISKYDPDASIEAQA